MHALILQTTCRNSTKAHCRNPKMNKIADCAYKRYHTNQQIKVLGFQLCSLPLSHTHTCMHVHARAHTHNLQQSDPFADDQLHCTKAQLRLIVWLPACTPTPIYTYCTLFSSSYTLAPSLAISRLLPLTIAYDSTFYLSLLYCEGDFHSCWCPQASTSLSMLTTEVHLA